MTARGEIKIVPKYASCLVCMCKSVYANAVVPGFITVRDNPYKANHYLGCLPCPVLNQL